MIIEGFHYDDGTPMKAGDKFQVRAASDREFIATASETGYEFPDGSGESWKEVRSYDGHYFHRTKLMLLERKLEAEFYLG